MTGAAPVGSAVGGRHGRGRRRSLREPDRFHFLGEGTQADVRLVDSLAQDAQIGGHRVGEGLLVGEGLPVDGGLLLEAGGHRLEQLGHRGQLGLQPRVLLLQHPEVRHHLLVLLVGGLERLRRRERQEEHRREEQPKVSNHDYFPVMTKCARRFLAQDSSSWSGSKGNSLP